jgi:hypothetical protein
MSEQGTAFLGEMLRCAQHDKHGGYGEMHSQTTHDALRIVENRTLSAVEGYGFAAISACKQVGNHTLLISV